MKRLEAVLLAMTAGLVGAGCGGMIKSLGGGPSKGDVDAAYARKDRAELDAICTGAKKSKKLGVKSHACSKRDLLDHDIAYEKAKGDPAALAKICNTAGNNSSPHREQACKDRSAASAEGFEKGIASCETVIPTWEKWNPLMSREDRSAAHQRAGLKMAQCGYLDYYWTKMAHWGNSKRDGGYQLLKKLQASGIDVEGWFMKYLRKHADRPFATEHGAYALHHTLQYLLDTDKAGDCRRLIPYARVSRGKRLGEWLWFFGKTSCTQAAPLAIPRLAASDPSVRSQACWVLGRTGSRQHVRKLSIVARTDPAYRIRGLNKIWYVRDACRAAVGKIEMRN